MDVPASRRRLPWGLLLAVGLIAVVFYFVMGPGDPGGRPSSWPAFAAATFTAAVAFVAGRWLLNYAWGLILALLVVLQPALLSREGATTVPVLAEGLQLLGLVLVLAGWRLAYLADTAWLEWLGLSGALCLDAGLAWVTEPRAGLTVLLFGGMALPAALALVEVRRRGGPTPLPSRANALLAFAAGLLAPTAGLLLAPSLATAMVSQGIGPHAVGDRAGVAGPSAGFELLRDTAFPAADTVALPGFAADEVGHWTWGLPWVVLALTGFGLVRSYLRGRWSLAEARVPLAWALLGYSAVVLAASCLRPDSVREANWLPLATLSTLLAVFGAGDLLRGLVQRLKLTPPGEPIEAP
jgi:hypothetical protein